MEQIPSWESNRSSASQEIPRILWHSNVHYRIHKRRLLSVQSQNNLVHAPILLLEEPFQYYPPPRSLSPRFPQQNQFSPILARCPAHLIFLDLTTRITFGEK